MVGKSIRKRLWIKATTEIISPCSKHMQKQSILSKVVFERRGLGRLSRALGRWIDMYYRSRLQSKLKSGEFGDSCILASQFLPAGRLSAPRQSQLWQRNVGCDPPWVLSAMPSQRRSKMVRILCFIVSIASKVSPIGSPARRTPSPFVHSCELDGCRPSPVWSRHEVEEFIVKPQGAIRSL